MALDNSTENFSVSFPSWLIEMVDALREEEGVSRSAFVVDSVKAYILKRKGETVWQRLYDDLIPKSS